jgi:hypothetical protein
MKATTFFPLLLTVTGSLAAPVPTSGDQLADYGSQTITIVRLSRHRGALDSFLASEEVSSTLKVDEDALIKADKEEMDNSPVDLEGLDISAPSPVLNVHQPLPTSFLIALAHHPEGSEPADAPKDVNWAMALLKDVYADYRSVSPCWRQVAGPDAEADTTTRIQRLIQGKADMLVIAGVACIVMFILVLEALFTAIQGYVFSSPPVFPGTQTDPIVSQTPSQPRRVWSDPP